MFGRSRPVVFNPYARRRSRWRAPRWLVLLLLGAALGVAGVLLVQQRYLPPRLSAAQSVQLRSELEEARRDSGRAHEEQAQSLARMSAALAEREQIQAELAASRASAQNAREVAASLVAALPADPRGGAIEVRAARFEPRGGELGYDIVLTRGKARAGLPGRPLGGLMNGVMYVVVSGANARGIEANVPAAAVPLAVGEHQGLRGSIALPAGFKPRQASIDLLDREGGKRLGMRVIRIDG